MIGGDYLREDIVKLVEAKEVIEKLANGMNPIDHSVVESTHFLNDSRVIRPLFYLVQYINDELAGKRKLVPKPTKFVITDEQLANISLPQGNIGINDFANAVNEVIDLSYSKKLSGTVVFKKLKELGILSESINTEGRRRTITNENSAAYGIECVKRFYKGRPYTQVVFNDIGKDFLIQNLRKLID